MNIYNGIIMLIPPTMEVRDEFVTRRVPDPSGAMCEACLVREFGSPVLVAQQIIPEGIKDFNHNYARIMLYVSEIPEEERAETLKFYNSEWDEETLSVMRKHHRNYVVLELTAIGASVSDLQPLEQVLVNGRIALYSCHIRKNGTNPKVVVKDYMLYVDKYQIEITMSYRVEDAKIYEEDFERVVNAFRVVSREYINSVANQLIQ